MSTEHCIECDAPINVREDVDCHTNDGPVCARCRGIPLCQRLIMADRHHPKVDQKLGVRVITRGQYNVEVVTRMAACVMEDGSFNDRVNPEPMGDCLIIETTPDTLPPGVARALALPGPRFRVKLGERFTGFDTREEAEAFIRAARSA